MVITVQDELLLTESYETTKHPIFQMSWDFLK